MAVTLAQLQMIGSWCGSHSTKLAAAYRACYMALAGLNVTHLTVEQFALIGLAAEAVLAVFVESTTTSIKRMSERVDEEKAKREDISTQIESGIRRGTGNGL